MSITLLLQSYGITGDYAFELHSRWSSAPGAGSWTANKAAPPKAPGAGAAIEAALATAEWPGFRGADRMGHTKAPKLATDWKANPPKLLWKKPVGAGWSSFAVAGPFAFTQEQRGPNEVVACYEVATGNEVWTQQREARFDEPMGGPGPRATPTLADGAVFVASASGMLQRLKASTGEVVWQQDFKSLSGRAELPMWGFAASPLVTHSLVIIYAGGPGDKGVMAFDAATGQPKWSVACGPESYSSPQLSKVLGEDTLLMLTNDGLLLLDPATGKVRLNYEWKFQGYRALQPTVIGDDVDLAAHADVGGHARHSRQQERRSTRRGRTVDLEALEDRLFRPHRAQRATSTASMAPCSVASISRPARARGRMGATAKARRCCLILPTRS